MKRNLTLFGFLIILLSVAYYFEEFKEIEARNQRIRAKQLFSDKEWNRVKQIGTLYTRQKQGDKLFQELKKTLQTIQIKRVLPPGHISTHNRKEYFPNEAEKFVLEFSSGQKKLLIGKKLSYDQSFYLEKTVGNKVEHFIVFDPSPEPSIYNPKTVYRSSAKYNRLKNLLYQKKI